MTYEDKQILLTALREKYNRQVSEIESVYALSCNMLPKSVPIRKKTLTYLVKEIVANFEGEFTFEDVRSGVLEHRSNAKIGSLKSVVSRLVTSEEIVIIKSRVGRSAAIYKLNGVVK